MNSNIKRRGKQQQHLKKIGAMRWNLFLGVVIFSVCAVGLAILGGGEIEEMRWPMDFVVKLLRVGQHQLVLHVGVVTNAHKVVVPRALGGNHEEAEESIGEQHLDFLVMRWQVAFGVVALVRVLTTPLISGRRQLVSRQRARSGGETACDDDSLLAIPRWIV